MCESIIFTVFNQKNKNDDTKNKSTQHKYFRGQGNG